MLCSRIEKYDDSKKAMLSGLKSVPSASITTDTWISAANKSYITLTEHHISNGWELKANVLRTYVMPERHTGENWRVEYPNSGLMAKSKCVYMTTLIISSLQGICVMKWGEFGCFTHTLQSCITVMFELPSVANIVSRCHMLVGNFKHMVEMQKHQQDPLSSRNMLRFSMCLHGVLSLYYHWPDDVAVAQRNVGLSQTCWTLVLLRSQMSISSWRTTNELSIVLADVMDVSTHVSAEISMSCSQIHIYSV